MSDHKQANEDSDAAWRWFETFREEILEDGKEITFPTMISALCWTLGWLMAIGTETEAQADELTKQIEAVLRQRARAMRDADSVEGSIH